MQDEQIRILCQHAVKYAPNGISAEAVADALGMRYATLMSQLSAQPGHKLGADIVLPVMQLTGSTAPMHHLARQGGGVMGEALRLGAALLAVLAGGGLALALVWNVANRRHLLRLQRALREREQKQERL